MITQCGNNYLEIGMVEGDGIRIVERHVDNYLEIGMVEGRCDDFDLVVWNLF